LLKQSISCNENTVWVTLSRFNLRARLYVTVWFKWSFDYSAKHKNDDILNASIEYTQIYRVEKWVVREFKLWSILFYSLTWSYVVVIVETSKEFWKLVSTYKSYVVFSIGNKEIDRTTDINILLQIYLKTYQTIG